MVGDSTRDGGPSQLSFVVHDPKANTSTSEKGKEAQREKLVDNMAHAAMSHPEAADIEDQQAANRDARSSDKCPHPSGKVQKDVAEVPTTTPASEQRPNTLQKQTEGAGSNACETHSEQECDNRLGSVAARQHKDGYCVVSLSDGLDLPSAAPIEVAIQPITEAGALS
jgi:hypothetical protein